ncbi:trk system potassium uptake protein TrkH [Fusobacterium naviforme]|uniref:Trk system potassium uptake protein TrkH n=1 Tax=Moryella indoligenes TaxID=371674 RepID=A0AAE3V9K8_9FIRM|nr:potassium transporter TrkG [Moryella indoligenes]MDQ0152226.1 trk system potassium uptake protein TrkH [Moryella indoligenes]PSL11030.1 trk system potassium uptake protein TrkH [Fusobacterium naviforme]STO28403.1 Ktr system potassium uptake protein B [Fusobacterium naviforme]
MHRFLLQKLQRLQSAQLILLGFAAMILTGALLLMLPVASREPYSVSFLDALFTATSATCVTGLVVYDTASCWTAFGQGVILLLIQIGGLGVVTIAVLLALISGKKIGLMQRSVMQDSIAAPHVQGIIRLTRFILCSTLLLELIGALLMLPSFAAVFGAARGSWYAFFHAVSGFCNAGFDLMGVREQFSSLTYFSEDLMLNAAVMLMIVIGGLGFLTWKDIAEHRLRFREYRLQSKAILSTTALLLLLPFCYFFLVEFRGLPLRARLLLSAFQAVTPRTAGFNTADYSAMSDTGVALTICLMLIGGAPGSTAGGMKVTTLIVLISSALSVFRQRKDTVLYGRRVSDAGVRDAAALLLMYLFLFLCGSFLLCGIEAVPLKLCMFETASAIGTVGLSMGLTPTLSATSRVILIVLMYMGRVGGLTLIFATVARQRNGSGRMPEEAIPVG